MAKYSINLLQADLIPPKIFWTLSRVASLFIIVLAIMLLEVAYIRVELNDLEPKFKTLSATSKSNKTTIKTLQAQINKDRKDSKLLTKLNTLKLLNNNKQHILDQLADPTKNYHSNFSDVMTMLAGFHSEKISLRGVQIDSGRIILSGVALSPDAVPSWLSGFDSSTFLSGKRFTNFTLSENEQQLTQFVVSSSIIQGG